MHPFQDDRFRGALSQDPPEDPYERDRIKGNILKKLEKMIAAAKMYSYILNLHRNLP